MRWTQIALGLTVTGAVAQLTCGQVILTAPKGSDLFLSINPAFIPANGGVAVVSALVIESSGTPVADGTVVQFFTTLGRIEEQGKTNDGVARVNFVSDSRSGTADISATSGEATDIGEVGIGTAVAEDIVLRAVPNRISANSSSTEIVATVYDKDNNPLPNVPVFFSTGGSCSSPTPEASPSPGASPAPPPVDPNASTDSVDNGGPIFTDNNGEARTTLRTRRTLSGTACVTARVPGPAQPESIGVPVVR